MWNEATDYTGRIHSCSEGNALVECRYSHLYFLPDFSDGAYSRTVAGEDISGPRTLDTDGAGDEEGAETDEGPVVASHPVVFAESSHVENLCKEKKIPV